MADFTWEPAYSWQHQYKRRVTITTFENGTEQRSDRGAGPREWTLSFIGPKATIAAIEAFWVSKAGPTQSFTWLPPDLTSEVTVRFADDTLKTKREGLNVWSIECTFKEVL
jgi:phage-related protein